MHTKSLRALMVGAAALAVATFAPSQAEAQIQVQVNYNLDLSSPGFGAGYNFGLGSLTAKNNITAVATFDYYLPKDFGGIYADAKTNYWEANFNGKMPIKSVAGLYAGAGVGVGHYSYSYNSVYGNYFDGLGSSDFHLNILGGYNFGSEKKGPFVEAGFNLGGGSSLRLGGGFRF